MPIVDVTGVGRVEFPDDWDQDRIISAIENDVIPQYKASHPEKTGFWSNLGQGISSTVRGTELGLGTLGRAEAETRQQAAINKAAAEQANVKSVSWPDVKESFTGKGVMSGLGSLGGFARDITAQSLPAAVPSVAGAVPGAAIGTAIMPGVGTIVGGLVGGIAGGMPQFIGQNVERRIEAKTPGPLVTPGVVGTAAAQSALEAGGLGFALGKSLVGKMLGKPLEKATDADVLKAAKQTMIGAGAGRAAKAAPVEGTVEVAQSILERNQAGLPLTTPDALKEYEESFAGGAVGGAAFGTVGGVSDRGAAINQKKEIEARQAADTQAEIQRVGREEAQRQGTVLDAEEEQLKQQAQEEMARQDADVTGAPSFEYDPTRIPEAPAETTPLAFDEWKRATGGTDPASYRRYVNNLQPSTYDPTRIPEAPAETTPLAFNEWKRATGGTDPASYRRYVNNLQPSTYDPTRIPEVAPTPEPTPPTITDKTLDTWGVSRGSKEGREVRSALLAAGDLSIPANVAAAKTTLEDYLGAKNRSTKQIELGTAALQQLDVIESQLKQQVPTNEKTTQTIPDTNKDRDRSILERQRTEQSLPLSPPQPISTPEETQGTQEGGVELPSGTVGAGDVVSGRSEEVGPDTLEAAPTPTIPESPRKEKIDRYIEEEGGTWDADNKLTGGLDEKPILPSAAERAYIDAKLAERDPQLSKKSKEAAKPVEEVPTEYSTPADVTQAVGELLTPNQIARKPPVVVNTLSDLRGKIPADVFDKVNQGSAKAFTYDGQDYYIAGHIPKGAEKGTILHEKGGHLGLPKLIGESRIKALANRINTWATEARSPLFGKEKVENKIAKEAMEKANASGETPGSDRHNQEVIAYFTEIAVNKYGIDPLKDQPKEFDKVVGWLRDLWAGTTYSLHKLHYAPQKLTAKDVVDLVMGAARVETTIGKPATAQTTPTTTPQLSYAPKPKPTPQDEAIASQAGIKLKYDKSPDTILGKLKARYTSLTDNDPFGFAGNKIVGVGTAFDYKATTMFGTERLNNATRKEHGHMAQQRNLMSDNIAMDAVKHGYIELDAEGVPHVRESNDNLENLNKLAEGIKTAMKADGMSDVLADTSLSYMLIADRYKELQAAGVLDPAEFSTAEYLYGKKMQVKYAPQLKEWRNMHQVIRGRTMDFLVDSGLFTRQKANEFLNKLEYVPFNREMPTDNQSQGQFIAGLLSAKYEHHIKGSQLDIKDIMENVINNQMWLMKRGMANNTANLVADTMTEMHNQNPLLGGHAIPANDKKGNNVEYFKNGKSQWFKVMNRNDAQIFSAAPALGNMAIDIMRSFSGLQRKGITLSPKFFYNQLIQDPMRAAAVAGTNAGPIGLMKTSLPEFVKNIFGETAIAREVRHTGVGGAIDHQDTYDNWNKEIRGEVRTGMSKVLEKMERVAQSQDISTRIAVYKNVMENGGSQNDASLRAIMMYNYQNRGTSVIVNYLIAATPFVNAKIQGNYRLLMALQGRIPGVKKADAYKQLLWHTSKLAAFTLMYTMAVSGDDEYEKADEGVKDRNFLLGGIRIPVAPELIPIKLLVEKAYRLATNQQFERPEEAYISFKNAVIGMGIGAGEVTPTAVRPIVEGLTNYSFFTGKELVGFNQQQTDTNLQFREGTSEISKALSNGLQEVGGNAANISPIKMDNFIKGMLGSLGDELIKITDMMAGEKPDPKINQLPIIGGAFYNLSGGALKSDLYDIKDKSDKARHSLKKLEENEPKKVAAYEKEHRDLLSVNDEVTEIAKELSEISKEKQYLTKQNPNTARPKIDKLDDAANRMLKARLPGIMKQLQE